MSFDIQVKIDPGNSEAALKQLIAGLKKAETQAREASKELRDGMAGAAKAFGPLADAIELETRVLERATGRSKDYGHQLAALQKLHTDGRISAEQYIRTLEKMGHTIEKTKLGGIAGQRAQTQQAIDTIGFGSAKPSSISQGGGMSKINAAGGALAAAAGGAALAHAAMEANDRWVELENSVRKFEGPGRSAGTVLHELGEMAHDLEQPIDQTIVLFDGVEGATKELGLTQREMIGISKTLGQVMLNDGKSIGEASAMLERLEFAMSTGTISGGELKKIMRQFPDIADMWTAATGKTRAELASLGLEGSESIAKLITSLGNGSEAAKKFEERGYKFGDTWHHVRDELEKPINFDYIADMIDYGKQAERVWDDFAKAVERGRAAMERKQNQQKTGAFIGLADGIGDVVDQAKHYADLALHAAGVTDEWRVETDKQTASVRRLNEELGKSVFGGRAFLTGVDSSIRGATRSMFDGPDSVTGGTITPAEASPQEALFSQRNQSDEFYRQQKEGLAEARRKHQDEETKANDELAESARKAAQETREAWASGLGEIGGSFLKMAADGKASWHEMTEQMIQDLTRLAIKMAIMKIASGGGSGAVAGQFLSGLAGGRNGFDYVANDAALQLPGFARGTDGMVRGGGSQDSHLLMARISSGESFHVRTPQQRQAEGEYMRGLENTARGGRARAAGARVTVIAPSDPREVTAAFGTFAGERAVARINRKFGKRRSG